MGTAILEEGTTSNRYTILGRLAGGGMADIFLARQATDAGVDRYVVLKRVLAERSRDPALAKMFLDEARLAAQLHHPNIAQVLDVGKLAGAYFFTMEYVHGEDVRHVMLRVAALRRKLPVAHALHVAAGALAGLHHAHAKCGSDGKPLGVVHRDVSPSNVMVAYEGVVKLLDFGVAKAAERMTESRSGTIKGKIAYLSPEQCKGRGVDRRSDIFSLGIVLYEMLVAKRLYRRDTDYETMTAIVNEETAPPSRLCPEVSPALDQLVLTALAKDADRRFATAADMLEAIETLAARDHHVLSATAMGRQMKELFGDRPEPWNELEVRDEETRAITITSESFTNGGDPLGDAEALAPDAPRPRLDTPARDALEAQLENAPALWRSEDPDVSPPLAGHGPASSQLPIPIVALRPTPVSGVPLTLQPAPLSGPVMYPSVSVGPPTRPVRARPPWVVAGASATLVLVLVVVVVRLAGSHREPSPPVDDAGIRTAVAPLDAAAAPILPAPDAASAPEATLTIAAALARKDWPATLERCAAARPGTLPPEDRARCGVAACNARQRAIALTYYQQAPKSDQLVIGRACRGQGIALSSPVVRPKDPCEINPLKCQE